jgi:hypothetical protein
VLDALLLHRAAHQLYRVFMHDDRVVGHERANTDRIVDGHQRLNAGTELAVVFFAQVMCTRDHILPELHQQLDDLQPLSGGFSFSKAAMSVVSLSRDAM